MSILDSHISELSMGTSKAYSGDDDEGGELTIETWACSRGLGGHFHKKG